MEITKNYFKRSHLTIEDQYLKCCCLNLSHLSKFYSLPSIFVFFYWDLAITSNDSFFIILNFYHLFNHLLFFVYISSNFIDFY